VDLDVERANKLWGEENTIDRITIPFTKDQLYEFDTFLNFLPKEINSFNNDDTIFGINKNIF
jgi:hypothetical protein